MLPDIKQFGLSCLYQVVRIFLRHLLLAVVGRSNWDGIPR